MRMSPEACNVPVGSAAIHVKAEYLEHRAAAGCRRNNQLYGASALLRNERGLMESDIFQRVKAGTKNLT